MTNTCVSCRKPKTVTGPRVRVSRSLRPSAVNSPLPEARRSAKPLLRERWRLVAFSESFVVRKLRGRVSFRLRSVSQITTGDFASGGGFGGVFCTRGADKVIAGATRRIKRAIVKTLGSAVPLFIRPVSGESVYLVESTESTAIPQCWGLITLLTNCRANELVNCGHCHCHCHWFFEVLRARWIQDVIDKDVAKQPLQLNVKG